MADQLFPEMPLLPAPGFEEWYRQYPKHVSPRQAEKAYRAALKRIGGNRDHAQGLLLTKCKAFADWCERNGKEDQFIPYPATWLNGDRWKDTYLGKTSAELALDREERLRESFDAKFRWEQTDRGWRKVPV